MSSREGRRASRWAAAAAVLVIGIAGGWWAGRQTVVAPTQEASALTERVVVTVTDASVGRVLTFNATVSQPFVPITSNALAGVVTAVTQAPVVNVGDQLYAVAGVPVRAVIGETPFYRDLFVGAQGPDVAQLQEALVTLGYLTSKTDGEFGTSTQLAVRAWQKAEGQQQTGSVRLGELVAVPALPTAVALDEGVRKGATLTGGEPAVKVRADDPAFALVLNQDQAAQVPAGATVDVVFGDRTWPAVVSGTTVLDNGVVSLALTAPDGSLVCGEECSQLPAEETVSLLSHVQVVPQVSGPGVPAAAVRTDASGGTYVLGVDGTQLPVTVRASGDGIAVVDGLAVGDQVLAAGGAGTSPGAAPSPAPSGSSDAPSGSGDGDG